MKTSAAPSSEERKARADRVKMLLEEVGFEEMWERARQDVIADFVNSEPHETKKREAAHQTLHVMEQFQRHITTILADGSVASMQLDRSKRRANR